MSIEVPAAWRRTSRDIFDAAKSEMRGARAVRPVVLPRRVKYRPAALHTLATRALRFDEIAVQKKRTRLSCALYVTTRLIQAPAAGAGDTAAVTRKSPP